MRTQDAGVAAPLMGMPTLPTSKDEYGAQLGVLGQHTATAYVEASCSRRPMRARFLLQYCGDTAEGYYRVDWEDPEGNSNGVFGERRVFFERPQTIEHD